jgi:hypothetical protein
MKALYRVLAILALLAGVHAAAQVGAQSTARHRARGRRRFGDVRRYEWKSVSTAKVRLDAFGALAGELPPADDAKPALRSAEQPGVGRGG